MRWRWHWQTTWTRLNQTRTRRPSSSWITTLASASTPTCLSTSTMLERKIRTNLTAGQPVLRLIAPYFRKFLSNALLFWKFQNASLVSEGWQNSETFLHLWNRCAHCALCGTGWSSNNNNSHVCWATYFLLKRLILLQTHCIHIFNLYSVCEFISISFCLLLKWIRRTLEMPKEFTSLTLSLPIPLRFYTLPCWSNTLIFNFWHSGALALRTECHGAQMSKI